MTRRAVLGCLMVVVAAWRAEARTSNGNDFALFFSEAKTERERTELLADARGRAHYFRYLQILKLEEGQKDGRPYVAITAIEPSSYMHVAFRATKSVSLRKLREDPESTIGDAIAVTGKIVSADSEKNLIEIHPVIVRHKDRPQPKTGKELLYEIDPKAIYYSYTGGKKAVHLTYKDRDLLKFKGEILETQGKQAWADFLERETARREKARERATDGH